MNPHSIKRAVFSGPILEVGLDQKVPNGPQFYSLFMSVNRHSFLHMTDSVRTENDNSLFSKTVADTQMQRLLENLAMKVEALLKNHIAQHKPPLPYNDLSLTQDPRTNSFVVDGVNFKIDNITNNGETARRIHAYPTEGHLVFRVSPNGYNVLKLLKRLDKRFDTSEKSLEAFYRQSAADKKFKHQSKENGEADGDIKNALTEVKRWFQKSDYEDLKTTFHFVCNNTSLINDFFKIAGEQS